MKHLLLFGLFLGHCLSSNAQDTFSITAVDTITGELGSAGASCIDDYLLPSGCYILSDVKPGNGVIHTQAQWNPTNQDYAGSLMDLGIPPEDIIDSLVANDVQNYPHNRQYGIIDFHEGVVRRAAYTGVNCYDYKSHILGPNYTIQGNILLGQQILDSMESRFLQTEGQLACKLMAALQGAKVLGADTRCFDDGTSSLSAFLRVGQIDDAPDDLYLDLNVPSTPFGMDPIDSLQTLVDEWGGCYISGIENSSRVIDIHTYPNPAGGQLLLRTSGKSLKNGEFTLTNIQGKVILVRKNLNGQEIQINNQLPAGLYFYVVRDDSGNYGNGKIIIK